MKKKLLALLLAAAMSMTLIACGGGEEEAVTKDAAAVEETVESEPAEDEVEEVTGDYTEEQVAFLEEFQVMMDDYNAVVDAANAVPELTANEQLVTMLNSLAAEIDSTAELMADPANLTDEFMAGTRTAMEQTYATMNRINGMVELLPILTMAGVGADEEGNSYLLGFNDDQTVGAMVILSADKTQNVWCAGDMTVTEDGTYTISNGEVEMTMLVEVVEEGLVITMQDGTVVAMVGADPVEVVDAMLAVQEATENVNEQ